MRNTLLFGVLIHVGWETFHHIYPLHFRLYGEYVQDNLFFKFFSLNFSLEMQTVEIFIY
jgi:hypothetical protein